MAETKTTRAEARAAGRTTFFTGKPCVRGNVAPRLVSNGACTCPLCKETRKAAVAAWQDKNRDALNEKRRERYDPEVAHGRYVRNRAAKLAKAAAWRAAHPDYFRNRAAAIKGEPTSRT